jgi:hypothetical protein
MALATLAKGPIGFILPLLVSLTFLAVERDWRAFREMKWLPGLILFLIPVLAWYLPAVLQGGTEYLQATLLHHSAARFAKGTSHVRPFYYFFYNFPVDFMPWTFFLPGAIAYGYYREAAEQKKEFVGLFVWFLVIFLFFSLSKGKRGLYLLPLFPAASLMVGKLWNDFISGGMDHFKQAWISIPIYVLTATILAAGGMLPWVTYTRFSSEFFHALPMGLFFVGIGLALLWSWKRRYHGAALFLLVGTVFVGFLYAFSVVFPLVNPFKSARFISREIASQIQPGEKLAVYGDFEPGPYNYYTGIVPILELEGEESLRRFLQSPERVFCLVRFRDLGALRLKEVHPFVELTSAHRVGHREMILISNR